MEYWKSLLLLLLLSAISPARPSHPPDRHDDLRIDCGALHGLRAITDDRYVWFTDDSFTDAGENYQFPIQTYDAMQSLRYFPKGRRNCYNLAFYTSQGKFLFRAGFYYGNYDGNSKPPSFNLEIDGNLWGTVTTSMSEEPMYHEMVYQVKRDEAQVCLVRTNDGVPFISSLEATYMYGLMYTLMGSSTALYLHSRINYGANETIAKLIGSDEECFNRKWRSEDLPEYLNITADWIPRVPLCSKENAAPWLVLATAIQAKNVSDSIYLPINFSSQTSSIAYFVLYFVDPIIRPPYNPISKVEIYVDGQKLGKTDVPSWDSQDVYHVVTLYPVQVNSSANVTISPAEGSTVAPILNAMEVFTVINVPNTGCSLKFSVALFLVFIHLLSIVLHGIEVYPEF